MKKLFLILSVALFALGTVNAFAQEAAAAAETQLAGDSLHHVMMQKFLEGGWAWMLPILIFLIIGLAVAIERILYLSLSTINSKKLITKVEEALKNGGIEAAKEVCRNTRGPIASIYYQGLDRYDQGLDSVEKAVVSYGSVQTGQMESGLTWIGLFIALSPMLGFMGTVVGMIAAFDAEGEVVSEQTLPETVKLRTGTASPSVQLCASFRQPWLYFIGKTDFSATEAMRYNYETGQVDWDYITADIDGSHEGGSLIYGYMGVHPTTEQLWVGKSSYTNSRIHLYDVSRSDAVEYGSYYQKKASPAGVDFAYRFTEEWINR